MLAFSSSPPAEFLAVIVRQVSISLSKRMRIKPFMFNARGSQRNRFHLLFGHYIAKHRFNPCLLPGLVKPVEILSVETERRFLIEVNQFGKINV
jgi:hypothetical protein